MKFTIAAASIAFFLVEISFSHASGFSRGRAALPDSIRNVYERATAVRTLRADRLREAVEFHITLKMRNYSDLQIRLSRGEKISSAEMTEKYLPLDADYQTIVAWIRSQGLQVRENDPNRLSIFVQGSVSQIQSALQVEFARVTVAEGDFTSALTAPTLPAELAGAVLGVNGLQPHLHPHKMDLKPAGISSSQPPYSVRQVLSAYNATGLGTDGTGEKIAVLIDTVPAHSDLTTFWSRNGIAQTLANIEEVNVTGAPLPTTSGEETLDVEWSSSLAPGAKVRIYATSSLSFNNLDRGLQRLISDLPTQPQIHALSISLGLGETEVSTSQLGTDSQYLAVIASYGVSTFVSTGDDGATTDGILQPSYYSTDPNVTAVGGTTLSISSTGAAASETGWSGSGGGQSTYFARPAWQIGQGVPAGTTRLVPDVAAIADPNTGAYVVWNGQAYQFGGTSLSAPTWAGFSALINQARIANHQSPLGPLNIKLYPLSGTSAFRDITSGSNGFAASPGYDLVTGLGVPNVSALLLALTGSATSTNNPAVPVAITTQPLSQVSAAGRNVTFTVSATGFPPPAYQWTKNGISISGATKPTFTLLNAQAADAGNYAVMVTNSAGSVLSNTAGLSVELSYLTTAGSYYGLITSSDATINGLSQIVTSPSGSFSGTIILNGLAHSVKGLLNNSGSWTGSIGILNGQPIIASLWLALDGSNQMTITISNGLSVASGTAARIVFHTKTNPASQRGTYTTVLAPDPNHADAGSPQGYGYASVKVDPFGTIRILGVLGDGTSFSQTTYLTENGTCDLYIPLYHRSGYITGSLTLDSTPPKTDLLGTLTWVKQATTGTAPYFGGFAIETQMAGSRYVPPAKRQTNLNFGTSQSATISFKSASISSIADLIKVWPSQVAPFPLQPLPLRISMSNATGYFSGAVLLPGAVKKAGFSGLILQKGNVGGAGLFLNSEGSGSVTLIPNP